MKITAMPINNLLSIQHKLPEQRLQQTVKNANQSLTIYPREYRQGIPLSFAQEQMWRLDRREPGNAADNRCTNILLTGDLNVLALEQAMNAMIHRHEILRTSFPIADGQPIQQIAPSLRLNLPLVTLRHLPINEKKIERDRIAVEEAKQKFDLSQLPLMKAKLLQLDEQEHILLLTMHPILCDGWSLSVFLEELAAHYEAFTAGKSSDLPRLPIQYADFAIWQREQLLGENLESQLAYWKKQLGGNLPVLELPTGQRSDAEYRPRSLAQAFPGARQEFWLSKPLSDALKQLSAREEVTLFVTLLTAFKILLYRYTGEEDILVGSPVAGRDRPETENLIGILTNPLALRSHLDGNLTFRECLHQVREIALEAFDHQPLPFEKLVEELYPERDFSHTPLFQVFFQFRNPTNSPIAAAGLTLEELEGDREIYPVDLTLDIVETAQGLVCDFEYNRDLFDAATIERMAGHFQVLLSGIVANAEQPVYQLPLLTEAERHWLFVEWNDTATDYPQDKCIHQLFEQQVEQTPDAVAVVFEGQELTYRQLNRRANQFAHYLQKLGVKPETFVGICLERSLEMIVGLLGILKAGAAYVPLDPAYPKERIDYILSNSDAKVLITSSQVLSSLPKHEAQVICLDTDWEEICQSNQGNPDSEVRPNNLSYVIYTSGSTGQPKGVQICHQSLVNFIHSMKNEPGLKRGDRILAITTICFDIHTLEIYLPLTVGATIILASREVAIDGLKLADTIARSRVNVMQATPATWQMLLTANWSESPDLKAICGGEALPGDLANRLLEKVSELWNIYGPTETTVWSTTREVKFNRENQYRKGTESIGRPIANTQIYILDKYFQPVPVGVVGELYIGGDGVARGYLNRPELNAERFLSDPFKPGSRMYKTGDLVRYRRDGNLEYLGRIDRQVKIRGFRIETGEIEAFLGEHPQVNEAAVIAREDIPGDKRLVAYLVAGETVPSINELRSFLKRKLPDYMVPSGFVVLERLPLTPNGKIDRLSLPAPDIASLYSDTTFVAPRNSTEKQLAAIWSQVLGLEKVGIHNNFFELGGHSLKATQVISGIRETFAVELPLRYLFSSPTIEELAKELARVIDSNLLPRGTVEAKAIAPRKADAVLTLSFAQERLWFLNQLEGESATYNIPSAWHLNGQLSIGALEAAVNEIIRRHEILRTTFTTQNGVPTQAIAAAQPMTIPVIDLQQIPETEQSQSVQNGISAEAQHPFNLATDPLIRVKVWRLNSQSHVLMFNIHHIVFDGWSMGVFWQELSALYQAFSCGETSPLPELQIQYADYALWQREFFQEILKETQINYWKTQLQGAPQLLELPADYARPSVQTFRGGTESFQLDKKLTKKLQQLSQRSGCTLFMTLLAAWSSWLYRYSGQSDILVGSPIANRNRVELEPLIGFFVNTLVMRTQFKDNESFADVLKSVRQTALDAYAHQDIPFEQLAIELQPNRSLSYNPLFQVMFAWQNAEMGTLEFPGIRGTQIEPETVVSKFDLTLSMSETESGLIGFWEYNSDLFDRSTIRRWIQHFQVLLEAIVTNPQQRVDRLPLLTENECDRLLVEWNDTATDYPQDKCIHQLFEAQVELTPDAVALVFEGQELTYSELNSRANQLAHYLQKLGVQPETLVGICVERSIEMIVGLLGIWKAGGAYLPIDPTYPSDRIAYMLENSQVPILLTQNHRTATVPEYHGHRIALDSDWDFISTENKDNPIGMVTSQNLAYMIYTSGSTGKPKGVLVGHQGLCNLASAQIGLFDVKKTSRILQFFSIAFDGAIWEIVMALCSGARLCLIPPESVRLASELKQLLQKHSITHLTVVPSALATLSCDDLPTLQTMIVAGEACPPELVQKWSKGRRFFNAYGPTEYTVCATVTECSDRNQKPSIGRPIANTQIYILDKLFQPVPIGAIGELYIGGAGVARGYLNRAEMTKQRFIPNPFSQETEARIYKTGDLARYLPNGDIEFLGRIDYQVKIRGLRIELGEIEAAIAHHPQVKEVIVIAREDIPGDKRLVAYIVPGSTVPSVNELRFFLKTKLPDYMVPSAFVSLEQLPLTPNGKIDRRALPAPDISGQSETAFVPPTNPTEEQLAAIWSKVLGLEQIGIHNNFFELGGHSLKATQVISGIRETFCIELPLRQLFEEPTVAELSQVIEKTLQTSDSVEASSIAPRKADAQLPLSFAQERLWFLNEIEGASATYNMASAWQLSGNLSVDCLEKAINEIIRRHESLRTNFTAVNGVAHQVIADNKTIKIRAIDLQEIPENERATEVQRLAAEEAESPFNLATDSLVRVKLLRLTSESHVLTIALHHIISDGWSMGVFWQELSVLYKAFSQGKNSPFNELPIQYADYAIWQREWFEENLQETQLNYWKKQLAGAPPFLELPTDRPRPSVQTFTGKKQSLILSESLSESIQELSQQEGVTPFMTLLAAFKLLLSRYTLSKDIVLGTPVAGRNRPEIEPLIGFFINTVVLRTDLNGHPTFRELLGRVREVTLGAYEHQEMPFEKLVEELQPERSGSYNPIFQVWFNLVNLEKAELELSGLNIEQISGEDAPAKFDLNLYVQETQQGIQLDLIYNADLFDAGRMECLLHQYQYILDQAIANPQDNIEKISLVTPEAKKRLPSPIQTLNSSEGEAVHLGFSKQAKKYPQKLAVVDSTSSWTYAELEERSNQLANYLLSREIQSQDIVAIYGNRSASLVVAILGILKAGAAFMILDPAYPTNRSIDCLQIARPSGWIELTETSVELQEFVKRLSCRCSVEITSTRNPISMGERPYSLKAWAPPNAPTRNPKSMGEGSLSPTLENISINAPKVKVKPDDLAYVAFTSGSTGKPKGIKGSHKPLSHFVQWHGRQFAFDRSDRFSLLSGLSHDPLLRDIFTPLSFGATLYIPSQSDIQTPGKLADWMQEKEITIAHLTPAMGQILSETSLKVSSLRSVFFAGDRLTQSDVLRMKQLAPNATCVNFYGTTETPQAMGYFVIPELEQAKSHDKIQVKESIPVGQGIDDVQLLILNENRQLAGIGELGEIYVRTAYLSQGYMGESEFTDKRFMLNPFTNELGDRLYQTGDLARYLPNGNIEFVGRIDNQVKIRGFRIELGEIEAVLGEYPEVKEAVVIAREDNPGDKRLVAYTVTGDRVSSASDLRSFLKTKLPDYMVPSAFVSLENVPLTPNGKIDRRALPAPDISTASEVGFIAPRDDLELRLKEIWQKVLGVTSIGVKDNFFDLGGHSLIAVRLFAEIEKAFGKNLPLATLFQAPTIEQLAHICRDKGWTAPWRSLVTIQPKGSKPPLFFVHGIYGNVLYFRELANYLGNDQPFYGLQAKGLDGKETPYTSLEDMAAHYVQEMRSLQPTGPYFIGGHSFGCIVAFEVAQQLYARGQEVALLALLDKGVSRNLNVPFWAWLKGHVKNLSSLESSEQRDYIWGRFSAKIKERLPKHILQAYKNLYDKEVAEHHQRFMTVMEANIEAINHYKPQVYPGKVTLFRAKIGSPRRYALDPLGGWGEFASQGVEAIDVPGEHMSLIKEPHLPVLAEELKACLEKNQENFEL